MSGWPNNGKRTARSLPEYERRRDQRVIRTPQSMLKDAPVGENAIAKRFRERDTAE